MKKRRLDIEYDYDFQLSGITSSSKGYKIAWHINQQLGFRLARTDDLQLEQKSGGMLTYQQYVHQSTVGVVKLFRNKANENDQPKSTLVPEYAFLDYVLMTQGDEFQDYNRLHELLRKIPSVELVTFLPLAALKSKDNFIF